MALEARVEEVVRECNSQEVANTLWAHATMGRKPGERALGALEARVEEVAREGNSEAVASTSRDIATMRWALGALDARAVVLSTDFGVREDALHVEGAYQNRGISFLDQLGGEAGVTTILGEIQSWRERRDANGDRVCARERERERGRESKSEREREL